MRNQLMRASAELARDSALVKDLDDRSEHPEQIAGYIDAKRRLDPEQKVVQELRSREAETEGLFAAEQSKWSDLSRRLDEIERLLGSRRY